jgi:hypothetical protein
MTPLKPKRPPAKIAEEIRDSCMNRQPSGPSPKSKISFTELLQKDFDPEKMLSDREKAKYRKAGADDILALDETIPEYKLLLKALDKITKKTGRLPPQYRRVLSDAGNSLELRARVFEYQGGEAHEEAGNPSLETRELNNIRAMLDVVRITKNMKPGKIKEKTGNTVPAIEDSNLTPEGIEKFFSILSILKEMAEEKNLLSQKEAGLAATNYTLFAHNLRHEIIPRFKELAEALHIPFNNPSLGRQ